MTDSNNKISVHEENLWIQKYLDSRDTQYLGNLYERYKQKIFVHCLKMVNNVEESEDLSSEAFIKAFDQIENFQSGLPFLPWLSRIATNLCIDHLRKRSRFRYQQINENQAVTNPNEKGHTENQKEVKTKILHVLQRLKLPQRRCFCLFYIHNISYNEIANITGYSINQVRSHIQNGRRRFKIFMEE